MDPQNLIAGPPPTHLPEEPAPRAELEAGVAPEVVAATHPDSCLVWAVLAEHALGRGEVVPSYAYARTGYHRGLDLLRRNGWKGHGPVPWEHAGNHGFLRSLAALARASHAIGDEAEYERCRTFLRESSPSAADVLSP